MKTPSEKAEQQKLAQAERNRQRLEKRASDDRVREQFKNFFIKLDKPSPKPKNDENKVKTESFAAKNFALKKDMRVAPMLRRCGFSSTERKRFEESTAAQNVKVDNLYLNEIKTQKRRPHRSKPDRAVQHSEDTGDVILDEEVVVEVEESASVAEKSVPSTIKNPPKAQKREKSSQRGKLLQFAENYRPSYYGTWRKRCKRLNGRRPFKRAYEHFDYDLDSDAEWEEEPADADECKSDDEEDCGSAGQDNNNDEDEDDDGFFVEHGYLSPDEEEEKASNDDDDSEKVDLDPEARRLKMKIRAETWKSEKLCRKWEQLKPVCIRNPVFCKNATSTDPPLLKPHFADRLKAMRAIIIEPIVVLSHNAALPVTPKNPQKLQKRKSTEKSASAAAASSTSAQKSASKSSAYKGIDAYCTTTGPPAAKVKRLDSDHVKKISFNHVTAKKTVSDHVTAIVASIAGHVTTTAQQNMSSGVDDHVIPKLAANHVTFTTTNHAYITNHLTADDPMTALKVHNDIPTILMETADTTEHNNMKTAEVYAHNSENDVICLDL